MKSFLGITGTTCVGKSEVAVILAKMLKSEIISADSMQIYNEMDIGTAKITQEEMRGVKHHLLDVAEPNEEFSAFQYRQRAVEIIDRAERIPIVVGGTGLYFDSIVYPPEFGAGDKIRRQELQEILAEQGLPALCEILKSADEETYETIDTKNPVRVMRAIEIAESGGKRSQGTGKIQPQYDCKLFVLQRERESLYRMIDNRVDSMVRAGLVQEVESIVEKYGYCKTPAFSAIGYKEIIEFLRGNTTLQEAVERIKINTRHYAKRQITYFKKMNVAQFIDVDGLSAQEVALKIANLVSK